MWTRALTDADASCGAKAAGLARLIAAGAQVPEGFVIERQAFREIAALEEVAPDAIGHALAEAGRRISDGPLPADLEREVSDAAAALGRLAVRSSASVEDGELGSAAGVFASITDVACTDVWDAVRAVWTSALTPLAVAYARRRDVAIAISVIVQRFVPGERMTVYTHAVGSPHRTDGQNSYDDLWLQRDGQLERIPRATAASHPEAAIALAAELAIAAPRGADVELILEPTPRGTRRWVVQARPIVHPVARPRPAPPAILLAPLVEDGRRWTWDIAHNPEPLSPAQAGLVDRVDRAAAAPYAMRVCGGYLYTTSREPGAPREPQVPPVDRDELASRIAAIEARFDVAEAPSVTVAIERYVGFMQIWAWELSPLIASARRKLIEQLAGQGHPPERIPALVAALVGPRRVLRDRVLSPAWDVAVPTFAEQAPTVTAPSDAPELSPVPEVLPPHELAADIALARAAADAAETDDLWFARAQWMVRRALLELGAAQGLRGDDIFWLPLDEVTQRSLDPEDAHRRASAARAAHRRAADWDMPVVIHGSEISPELSSSPRMLLKGVGLGPRVVGRVVRIASLGSLGAPPPIGRSDVVVTRAVTPALAMIVQGCAALVSETGGLLDHGAALARELGITCVVGCVGAWAQFTDGDVISVDGDAGAVGLA